jgi:putative alpha-1,2-mannosidase
MEREPVGERFVGNHLKSFRGYYRVQNSTKGEKVSLKVASSFISIEQAELNLKRELGKDNFETTKAKAKSLWNKALSKISVEGGSIDQVRTFYSCLYRTLCFPNKLYEIDAVGKIVHYSPYTGKILPGYMFGGTGFLGYLPRVISIPKPDVSLLSIKRCRRG